MSDVKQTNLLKLGCTTKKVDAKDATTNCWFPLCGSEFNVRSKVSDKKSKKKEISKEGILELYSVDVFRGNKKLTNIMERFELPQDIPKIERDENDGGFYVPQLLVLNFMAPNYPAPNAFWGTPKDDGESFSFVFTYIFTQKVYEDMKNDASPVHSLLKNWLQADPVSKEDYDMRGRLKAIPCLLNSEEVHLGMLKPLVSMYDSKPFLTGPKYHSFIKKENYLEVDVDIHRYVVLARSTFYSLVPEVKKMKLNFGIVIEGRFPEEMPEQMLAGCQIVKVDIQNAKLLE